LRTASAGSARVDGSLTVMTMRGAPDGVTGAV
jgi:hypothetical protein